MHGHHHFSHIHHSTHFSSNEIPCWAAPSAPAGALLSSASTWAACGWWPESLVPSPRRWQRWCTVGRMGRVRARRARSARVHLEHSRCWWSARAAPAIAPSCSPTASSCPPGRSCRRLRSDRRVHTSSAGAHPHHHHHRDHHHRHRHQRSAFPASSWILSMEANLKRSSTDSSTSGCGPCAAAMTRAPPRPYVRRSASELSIWVSNGNEFGYSLRHWNCFSG